MSQRRARAFFFCPCVHDAYTRLSRRVEAGRTRYVKAMRPGFGPRMGHGRPREKTAALELGVSERTIDRLRNQGRSPGISSAQRPSSLRRVNRCFPLPSERRSGGLAASPAARRVQVDAELRRVVDLDGRAYRRRRPGAAEQERAHRCGVSSRRCPADAVVVEWTLDRLRPWPEVGSREHYHRHSPCARDPLRR
jgi:hypothetical protein